MPARRGAMSGKNAYIVAGPNGSGKTTFARKFLPKYARCPHFVNADLIAQGLSPFSPRIAAIRAGRLVLERIEGHVKREEDFAFETTLSGKSYAHLFRQLKAAGYYLHLFFLWIPSPELALIRIKERVAHGGHDVPATDVRRRFHRGIRNAFGLYKPLVHVWTLFDNSEKEPWVVAREEAGELRVFNQAVFEDIMKVVER